MTNMLNANSFELQDWLKDASAEELQPYVYSYDFSENYDEDNPVHSNWMTIVDIYAAYLSDGIKGAQPDYEEAFRLLEITAYVGHRLMGYANLAEMYELGKGIAVDFSRARELYNVVIEDAEQKKLRTPYAEFAAERLQSMEEKTNNFSMRIFDRPSTNFNTAKVRGHISSGVVSNDDKVLMVGAQGRTKAKVLQIFNENYEISSAAEGEDVTLVLMQEADGLHFYGGDYVCSIGYNLTNLKKDGGVSTSIAQNATEKEYLEEYKCMLADGEIGERERKSLNRLCERLGLSSTRAAELEAAAMGKPLSKEEQEYLDEYREMLADGGVRDRDRRTLQRLAQRNGISDARTRELERLA